MIKYVFFDLDGTLTDSGEGIMNSAAYALRKRGIAFDGIDSLRHFVGPPLKDSFMRYVGDPDVAEEMIGEYREYYSEKGIYENKLYPHIVDMLEALKNDGYCLVVATSKPELMAEFVLKYFDIRKYFEIVCGASMDEKLSKKEEIIAIAMNMCGASKDNTIMVGDTTYDIFGAHQNGIPAIAVTFGYGNPAGFSDAEFVTDTALGIVDILREKNNAQ